MKNSGYGKEEFYLQELKRVHGEFEALQKQIDDLSEIRRKRGKLIKNLLNVLKLTHGENSAREILEKNDLGALVREFFIEHQEVALAKPTVYRRRKGTLKPVLPENILKNGTKVRMLSGLYKDYEGRIASVQAVEGKGELDVTYFISVKDKTGALKRTSTKHTALGKSYTQVVE